MNRRVGIVVLAVMCLMPQAALAGGFRGMLRYLGAHYGEGIHANDACSGCGQHVHWESVPPPASRPLRSDVEPSGGSHDLPMRYPDPSAWRWTWPGAVNR